MTVTSNNVLGFKEYLKNNKEAFKSNIIPAYMGDISASLGGSFPAGTNALTPIKVILFDYNETVDIQNELLTGDYVYLPGTSNDKVRLQNGTAYADFNFDANGDVTGQTVGNYYVVGGYRLELLNIGGGLYQSSSAPGYTMNQSTTSLNEGETVTFTITTTNVQDGTVVNYNTTGTVESSDFTDGVLSGSATITNNSGSFTRTLVNDFTVGEGAENFTITLSQGGNVVATGNQIAVADTSVASYNVASGSASVPLTSGIINGAEIDSNGTGYVVGDQVTLAQSHLMPAGQPGTNATLEVTSVTVAGGVDGFTIVNGGQDFGLSDPANSNDYWEARGGTGNDNFRIKIIGVTTTVPENNPITFTVTTSGVPDGTNLYYTLTSTNEETGILSSGGPFTIRQTSTGTSVSEFNNNSGFFTINNNTGSVTLTAEQDFVVETDETITFQVRTSSTSGPIVTSTTAVINDAPFSVTVTPASTSINEPLTGTANIVLNVTTTGVNDGVVLVATLNPSSTATQGLGQDFDSFSTSATVNNNAATFTIPVRRDGRTEGAETAIFDIQTSGLVIATSPAITINDTSYVGLNHTGKTFGPININRDNGNAANATDIYALCNLDQLADGSDVALFVDNSGSMTTSTIQAAYDSLISQLNARNMSVIVVTNTAEDWISDFDTTL